MDIDGVHENARDDPEQRPASPAAQPPGSRDSRWKRLAVGALVTFIFMSLLYGVNQVVTLIVFAAICTVGIALIPMAFLCWLVGWVVLAVWRSLMKPRVAGTAS